LSADLVVLLMSTTREYFAEEKNDFSDKGSGRETLHAHDSWIQ
jgi:hypothetical protein